MALRSSISCRCHSQIVKRIIEIMGLRPNARGKHPVPPTSTSTFPRQIICFALNAAPSSNDEAYAPTGVGDFCLDELNNDIYRCSAFTSTSSFTWTKIVD